MKKEMTKRICVMIVVSIFLILLVSQVVMAAWPKFGGSINDWFTQWKAGNLDVNIAKFLFFIMIVMICYLVISQIFEKPYIIWPLSAVIAFLATAYITPKEIFSILTSYTAFGVTISVFLPLVILLIFTFSETKFTSGKLIISYFIWIFWLVYLVYRLIAGIATGEASSFLNVLMGIAMIVSIIVIMATGKIRAALGKAVTEQVITRAGQRRQLAAAREKGQAETEEALGSE